MAEGVAVFLAFSVVKISFAVNLDGLLKLQENIGLYRRSFHLMIIIN